MTENDKSLLRAPPGFSDPDRYQVTSNGAVKDLQAGGRIVAMDPSRNPAAFTPENGAAMQKKGMAARRIREMRGIALGHGIELPDDADLEQIAAAAGSAWEALIAHTYRVYMSSKNIRGMGEIIPKLASAFQDDDDEDGAGDRDNRPRVLVLLAELTRRRENPGEIIDG